MSWNGKSIATAELSRSGSCTIRSLADTFDGAVADAHTGVAPQIARTASVLGPVPLPDRCHRSPPAAHFVRRAAHLPKAHIVELCGGKGGQAARSSSECSGGRSVDTVPLGATAWSALAPSGCASGLRSAPALAAAPAQTVRDADPARLQLRAKATAALAAHRTVLADSSICWLVRPGRPASFASCSVALCRSSSSKLLIIVKFAAAQKQGPSSDNAASRPLRSSGLPTDSDSDSSTCWPRVRLRDKDKLHAARQLPGYDALRNRRWLLHKRLARLDRATAKARKRRCHVDSGPRVLERWQLFGHKVCDGSILTQKVTPSGLLDRGDIQLCVRSRSRNNKRKSPAWQRCPKCVQARRDCASHDVGPEREPESA